LFLPKLSFTKTKIYIWGKNIQRDIKKRGFCSDFSSITEQPEAVTQTEGRTPVFQTTTLNANTGYAIQSDNFQFMIMNENVWHFIIKIS
jgi:hypothetical protein